MTPGCPWCRGTFPTWPLARIHVKNCPKSPRPRWKDPRRGNILADFRPCATQREAGSVIRGPKQ